ncbi:MAG: AAA family ATPase [Clostridia bacterium]|nr:AAA family ATPase [Clostridia bacterium]
MMTAIASEDFKKNIQGGFRYVDKTELLISLLDGSHESTFFLRPRRFGKTLTLSMIHYFMEDTRNEALNAENRKLFEGLRIMEAGGKYTREMTSAPVIHLTFQNVKDETFKDAFDLLLSEIQDLYAKNQYLLKDGKLTEEDEAYFLRILRGQDLQGRKRTRADCLKSLQKMTEFLHRASGKKAVVLIDEYDVPLEQAYRRGYYQKMVGVIGPMLQYVLKTNSENLHFAVVTGCLRIAKEGIYTGLNNPDVNTVLSHRLCDAIGFTEGEVRKLLLDSGVPEAFEKVKEWYDGYRFGDAVIYNPWSVIRYIEDVTVKPDAPPLPYWANTSENAIIREAAQEAGQGSRDQMEKLMQGEEIAFSLRENIVYDDLYSDADNLWNIMLSSGYLTVTAFDGEQVRARIPNREIHKIFRDQIQSWFDERVKSFDVRWLYTFLVDGNAEEVEKILSDQFLSAMSYYDTVEAFYHGVLLTLMQLNPDYICVSNRESGRGRFDVAAKQRNRWETAIILEAKISKSSARMLSDAKGAAAQIEKRKYRKDLEREGYRTIMTYGISFFGKRCRVVQGVTAGCGKG